MSSPDATPTGPTSTPVPSPDELAPRTTTGDPQSQQQGGTLQGDHVPEPDGGVRGADQVDAFDAEPGEGTTRGADGDTAAREALRKDLGERASGVGEETGADLEQTAALGATDDPEGGSVQQDGSSPA